MASNPLVTVPILQLLAKLVKRVATLVCDLFNTLSGIVRFLRHPVEPVADGRQVKLCK